jgi:hypothetical protein
VGDLQLNMRKTKAERPNGPSHGLKVFLSAISLGRNESEKVKTSSARPRAKLAKEGPAVIAYHAANADYRLVASSKRSSASSAPSIPSRKTIRRIRAVFGGRTLSWEKVFQECWDPDSSAINSWRI